MPFDHLPIYLMQNLIIW